MRLAYSSGVQSLLAVMNASRARRARWAAVAIAALTFAAPARAQVVVHSQTSLAGSTGTVPGLYDQLGLLAGTASERRDFYEIFTNGTGQEVLVNRAVLYGNVNQPSTAVIVPVVNGTIDGFPDVLLPDTDPAHALATASVPVSPTSDMGLVEISFSPGVVMPPGSRLAFGFRVPTVGTVDATLFGTDTLPSEFSSPTPPRFWTGFYATISSGEMVRAVGNHYLVISQAADPIATTTAVYSNNNPSTFGQDVTFSASVAPSAATGTATIRDGVAIVGTCTLVSGSCDVSTSALAVGSHSITAIFSGGGDHAASGSSPLTQVVDARSFEIRASVAGGSGTITPAGVTVVPEGGSQTYSITPAAGYRLNYVAVNGMFVGAPASYTFTNVRGSATITADFVPVTYTIAVTQTPNGFVSPYTYSGFKAGASQGYAISPKAGYHVADVEVDGTSVGAVTSYSFTNIQANHTIRATFAANPSYTIQATAGPNGSISPAGATTVLGGLGQKYTVAPSSGYRVAGVVVDGVAKGALTSYTFSAVAANHAIDATFVRDEYTVTASVLGGQGTITPPGATVVPGGGSQSYAISPAGGYRINYVAVNGFSVGQVASYTLGDVRRDSTIAVHFVPITYTITVTQAANGLISGATFSGFVAGASHTYTVTPSAGYRVSDVLVDGSSVGAVASYTFTDIRGDHSITARFEPSP